MKRNLRFFAAFLMVAAFVTAGLVSCVNPNDDTDGDAGKQNSDGLDISEYSIIYPQKASDDIKNASSALSRMIENKTGVKLLLSDDTPDESIDAEAAKEILIGETDRAKTESAKEKLDGEKSKNAFVIEMSDDKIVILGKNDDITVRAVKYFVSSVVNKSESEGTLPIKEKISVIKKADTSTVIFSKNLVELRFGEKSTVFTHSSITASNYYYYPTATKLKYQKNESDNGVMLATLNSSEHFYRVLKSTDDGAAWQEVSTVYDTLNKSCRGGRMPMIYELPADLGEFKKGTVLLAGTSSALSTSDEMSAIVIYSSADLGKTWTTQCNVDVAQGRADGEGVWEPCLIYEEETGRLYCFYSDDSDPKHDQKIVFKYTTDLVNWVGKDGEVGAQGTPIDAVASSNSKLRPGMVSLAEMNNGEYVMIYEVGHSKFGDSTATVHIKKSKRLDDWSDVSSAGEQIISVDKHAFGSAPWCAYTPEGGENGLLITTGRYRDDRYTNPGAPELFLSFDYGETFERIDNPFEYSNSDLSLGKFGYSPYFLASEDGKTLYYFNTSTFAPMNKVQYIEMIKIEVIG